MAVVIVVAARIRGTSVASTRPSSSAVEAKGRSNPMRVLLDDYGRERIGVQLGLHRLQ
jgi:hypothetical protein